MFFAITGNFLEFGLIGPRLDDAWTHLGHTLDIAWSYGSASCAAGVWTTDLGNNQKSVRHFSAEYKNPFRCAGLTNPALYRWIPLPALPLAVLRRFRVAPLLVHWYVA